MFLTCKSCGKRYGEDQKLWQCPCGGYLDLQVEDERSVDKISIAAGPENMWRYRDLIPLAEGTEPVSMGEGMTPLVKAKWSGSEIYLKLDFLCPTGSYKDRGISFLISKLKELGIEHVVEDSSGNAGSSMAAYCARAGMDCDIFVPSYTSPGKCVQIEMYGARLHKVPGTREDTTRAAMEAAREIYYASHNWSPYFVHGMKTFAFEIWEQLGWRAPHNLIIPVGQGSLVMGAYLGFSELQRAGMIHHVPRIYGVQSRGCAPLYQAVVEGGMEPVKITKDETIAEGISSAEPVKGKRVIREVLESGGGFLAVEDRQVWHALKRLCRKGFYVEPTSAVIGPALDELVAMGKLPEGEISVAILTGSGLKATSKIMKYMDKLNNPPEN